MNIRSARRGILLLTLFLGFSGGDITLGAAESEPASLNERHGDSEWQQRVADHFRKGVDELSLSLAVGLGMPVMGTTAHHHWGLGFVEYGHMLSDVVAEDHWYRGNWEVLGDLWGGFQFHPNHAYIAGLTPLLRYNFVTGTRWVPFFDVGGGVTATDIRNGDLSTTFEFNLQVGPGVHYFVKENVAVTMQYRFIHVSNAGLDTPNKGVNTGTVMVGVRWFF